MISLSTSVLKNHTIALSCFLISMTFSAHAADQTVAPIQDMTATTTTTRVVDRASFIPLNQRTIRALHVKGNTYVPATTVLRHVPYQIGETFDPNKTRTLIRNLYYDLGRFRNISVSAELIAPDGIELIINVEEKKLLKDVIIEGNNNVSRKEIDKKVPFEDTHAIDEQELKRFALAIKNVYGEKGYHRVDIETELRDEGNNQATAVFTITEYKKSLVKKVDFIGNNNIRGKELRSNIYTREDWIVGAFDKSGTYQPERIEADKRRIEEIYQNKGFINAKVVEAHVEMNPKTENINVTYEIKEGDQYTIKDVKAVGNDILTEEQLSRALPMKAGDIYSRERLIDTMKVLEMVWGNRGYIYAHIEPSIQPNDEDKTLDIAFHSDLGKQVFLNKVIVKGNKKTRDRIIRRQFNLEEGGLLTNIGMESTKSRVESLGYFDQRDGVNWKTIRLNEELADLELIIKEAKTGSAHIKLTFGGNERKNSTNPLSGMALEAACADSNLFGSGIRFNLTGTMSVNAKTIAANLTQPWLFDKPIFGAVDVYHKRIGYDEMRLTAPVNEAHTAGSIASGFVIGRQYGGLFRDTFLRSMFSIENINYGRTSDGKDIIPRANISVLSGQERLDADAAYNNVLSELFSPGLFVSLALQAGQDKRNHPMHPSRGHSWLARSIFSFPIMDSRIGYHKFDLDMNWFTPLINDRDLVFRLHGHLGIVTPFKNRIAPYNELYHVGGPASVRGFLFGRISPQFAIESDGRIIGDSIGGRKGMYINAELIFPITADFSMKGVVFYDGGAGWDTPTCLNVPDRFLIKNRFDYRHAVGFGIRLLNPMPIKVDWGFKIDPRTGETGHEVHFGMNYGW